ncbi:polymer-forming cytoskeletal protein [Paenibacillus sp. HB172176]|uniref:polymer-forming cytoskeletal protein n=1 Tax=Paenibacillus sp. HB172176 TaxID=2493690 RepID=UPI001438C413|nr:polymer-forming cytoskeletal protein [Paenibacillus sp. HB172176]
MMTASEPISQGNLRILGSSTASGGRYEKATITGEGRIHGDMSCEQLKVIGTLQMEGNLQAAHMKIVGTAEFDGSVQAGEISVAGTAFVKGNSVIRTAEGGGTLEVAGSLRGETMKLKGELTVRGDCEYERFETKGIFHIGGLLSADIVDVRMYQDCDAEELGGGSITVKRASAMNVFNLFFKPSPHAMFHAGAVEGDEIYLEYTRARLVRGKHVRIGPGCDIERIEYATKLDVHRSSTVKEKLNK